MNPNPNGPAVLAARRVVPVATLVCSLLAATAATIAVVVSVSRPAPEKVGERVPLADEKPYVQEGTVKPEGQASGTVFYPLPYASPPALALNPGGRYCIARQDELGFTWVDRRRLKELPDLVKEHPDLGRALGTGAEPDKQPAGPQPDLAWEARGVRAASNATGLRPLSQTGTFQCFAGGEGEVYFTIPYASPPNVELTSLQGVAVTACTPLGFAWRSTEPAGRNPRSGPATWTAKGVKGTGESHQAEIGRLRAHTGLMPGNLLKQEGTFAPVGGEGEVMFPFPYAAPPNVELFYNEDGEKGHVNWATVSEHKATGFKWRTVEVYKNPRRLYWVAKGLPAADRK